MASKHSPLTPAVFYILLSLVSRERHGYDIMQDVQELSGNTVSMGPGTLYGSIDRMMKSGLVAESNRQDPRRIYYKLTAQGRSVLQAETERLSRASEIARSKLRTA